LTPQAQAERIRKKKDHSSLLTLIKESTPPADFYHTKITTFKTIGDKHPEVLAEWRAKRAAEFVSKNPHALEVPKTRYVRTSLLNAHAATFCYVQETTAECLRWKPLIKCYI
jgi:hypothetical protein